MDSHYLKSLVAVGIRTWVISVLATAKTLFSKDYGGLIDNRKVNSEKKFYIKIVKI